MLAYDLWLMAYRRALLLRKHTIHISGGIPSLKNLERRVAKVGEDVVDGGFGQVVGEVLPGSLASDYRLSAIAEHGQLHSTHKSQQACSHSAHTVMAACSPPFQGYSPQQMVIL